MASTPNMDNPDDDEDISVGSTPKTKRKLSFSLPTRDKKARLPITDDRKPAAKTTLKNPPWAVSKTKKGRPIKKKGPAPSPVKQKDSVSVIFQRMVETDMVKKEKTQQV